jgi:pyridoxamine 5'-phosphate oxidase family protein
MLSQIGEVRPRTQSQNFAYIERYGGILEPSHYILSGCLNRIEREIQLLSEPETKYLKSQRLARIATVSKKGQPDVVPVGFEYDGKYFWIGSHSQDIFFRTSKYRNVKNGNNKVSLVVDDLKSVDPWHPRCVKVYGTAEVMDHDGIFGPGKYLRIKPSITWSMGIEGLNLKQGEFRLKTMDS